jgi:pimeloyl-ACP methyl ester carboxylesterase
MINYADTSLLRIAYFEDGEKENPAILLIHGWPDDATTWDGVRPLLVKNGYRVIAPWLRGFGNTEFKEEVTERTGNAAMIAYDLIELMDTLGISQFCIAGQDWGSNIGEALAIGWPERIKKIAFLSSPPRLGSMQTTTFPHAQLQWYHWFMATKQGADSVYKNPIDFTRIMWENWSPKGWYSENTFKEVSKSWGNPDFVDITIHSYRSRWGEAEPDKKSKNLEDKILETKMLNLPALFIQGELDGVNPPYVSEHVHKKFQGEFNRIVLAGVGHFPSRETPELLAEILIDFFRANTQQNISELNKWEQ